MNTGMVPSPAKRSSNGIWLDRSQCNFVLCFRLCNNCILYHKHSLLCSASLTLDESLMCLWEWKISRKVCWLRELCKLTLKGVNFFSLLYSNTWTKKIQSKCVKSIRDKSSAGGQKNPFKLPFMSVLVNWKFEAIAKLCEKVVKLSLYNHKRYFVLLLLSFSHFILPDIVQWTRAIT